MAFVLRKERNVIVKDGTKMTIQEKMDALKSYFAAHPKLVLGFSGGVDS